MKHKKHPLLFMLLFLLPAVLVLLSGCQKTKPLEDTAYTDEYGVHPAAPKADYVLNLKVPEYSGKPYIMLNDGNPFFETEGIGTKAYATYYALDHLGRCTLAGRLVEAEHLARTHHDAVDSLGAQVDIRVAVGIAGSACTIGADHAQAVHQLCFGHISQHTLAVQLHHRVGLAPINMLGHLSVQLVC